MGYWIQGQKKVALPYVLLGYLSDALESTEAPWET